MEDRAETVMFSRSVPGGSCRCVRCPGGHDGLRRQAARGHPIPPAGQFIEVEGGAAACKPSSVPRARARPGAEPAVVPDPLAPAETWKDMRLALGEKLAGVPSRDPDRSTGPWLELAAGGRHLCVAGRAQGGARRAGASIASVSGARDPGGPFLGAAPFRDRLRAVLPPGVPPASCCCPPVTHPWAGDPRLVQTTWRRCPASGRCSLRTLVYPFGLRDGRRRLAQRVRAAGGAGGLYPPRRHPAGASGQKPFFANCARPLALLKDFITTPGAAPIAICGLPVVIITGDRDNHGVAGKSMPAPALAATVAERQAGLSPPASAHMPHHAAPRTPIIAANRGVGAGAGSADISQAA